MKLKQSLIIAGILCSVMIVGWELYWRSQGLEAKLDDNAELWASQRAKLNNLEDNQVVFIGSSRILFDIDLDIWREQTGTDPVMIANPGSTPHPILRDVVENTDFAGTMVVGVTPPLFFSTTFPKAPPVERAQARVDYFQKRTYTQQINQWLSIPLQQNLVFIKAGDENWDDDVDLKTLFKQIQIGERAGPYGTPFYSFENTSLDRNVKVSEKTTRDTAFAGTVKKFWLQVMGGHMPPPDKNGTTAFFMEYLQKFKDRGGKVVLVRCPVGGVLKVGEAKGMPRASFWDSLVGVAQVPAYHYEDYPQFLDLNLPEWSHLSAEDAAFFTRELIAIMQKDGLFIKPKTN